MKICLRCNSLRSDVLKFIGLVCFWFSYTYLGILCLLYGDQEELEMLNKMMGDDGGCNSTYIIVCTVCHMYYKI